MTNDELIKENARLQKLLASSLETIEGLSDTILNIRGYYETHMDEFVRRFFTVNMHSKPEIVEALVNELRLDRKKRLATEEHPGKPPKFI